ncbi:MAG: tripartite tricarboxylate transporter substrate binding protein [Burkholderiaceae bacterium]|jgi:tripartite-type tricarboxylate transporter receptor subunit TctC|nr:tripartite tricarboxylate transporter substrate binding protein [Burkholderiaceae bacterium]
MNRRLFLLATALAAAIRPATAQSGYPVKTIHLIVPTPAGGPSDAAARLLAQAISKPLGQLIIIENKPGAGGAIAAQALMAAPADGHTLMWTLSSMSGLSELQKASPYRSLAELTPVALVGHFAYAMFVHPDVPAKTVAEFVEYAGARPDKISYATGSLGDYMAATRFLAATGVRAVRVPYRGGSLLMPDLVTGRVQLNFGPVSSGLQHVREGKLRMLAVLLPQRSALAPDVPTLTEAGVRGVSLPTWQALFAPANTPQEVAQRLSREVATALAEPALRAQFEQLALLVDTSSPQRLATVAEQATQAWRAFASDYQIAPE